MTTLLKIFSKLFGYDYQTVLRQPTASKQKVVTLGLLLTIPVILWAFSGFYIAHVLLGLGMLGSICSGLITGGVILVIDRSFIATPYTSGGAGLKVLRFVFALISTVLGSIALDLALFQGDLAEYRLVLQKEERDAAALEFKEDHGERLTSLQDEYEALQKREEKLGEQHVMEMTGKGGSGRSGKGAISDAIFAQKAEVFSEKMRIESELGQERDSLDRAATKYAEEKVVKRQDALLSQLKDLHGFVFSDGYALGIYWFFFGFVFLLESFFIAYKISTSETLYEQWIHAEEEYGKQRLEAYRRRKSDQAAAYQVLGDDYHQVMKVLDVQSPTRRIV